MVVTRQLDSTGTECMEAPPCRVCCAQVVVGRQLDSIFMVMEYMEHDLKGLSENMRQPFTTAEVRRQGWQRHLGASVSENGAGVYQSCRGWLCVTGVHA